MHMDSNCSPAQRLINPSISEEAAERLKRSYAPPVLRVYGSVRQITLGATGANGDGVAAFKKQGGSDRSIKESIVQVGKHPLGIGLYLFDYKAEYRDENGYGRQFGVMADEVEAVLPQAVGRHPRGHKTVDYAMLGISKPGLGLH